MCTLKFLAPQIVSVIYCKYFDGPKTKGRYEHDFIDKFTGEFICLAASVLYHVLKSWRSGVFLKPAELSASNQAALGK